MLAVDVLNCFRGVLRCDQQTHHIRGSIVVSISACHAEDPGFPAAESFASDCIASNQKNHGLKQHMHVVEVLQPCGSNTCGSGSHVMTP